MTLAVFDTIETKRADGPGDDIVLIVSTAAHGRAGGPTDTGSEHLAHPPAQGDDQPMCQRIPRE